MFQSCLCRSKFVPMTCISSKHRGSSWRLHHVLFLMACFCLLPDCPICGEEDFWRFDGKVLTRIHKRPRINLFDPSVAMDMPVDAEKLQAVRVTKIVRQGAETSVSQEDEDWRAIEARGSFPYLFTGESIFVVLEEHINWNLYNEGAEAARAERHSCIQPQERAGRKVQRMAERHPRIQPDGEAPVDAPDAPVAAQRCGIRFHVGDRSAGDIWNWASRLRKRAAPRGLCPR